MAGGFEIFDCSVGKDDSELDREISFLAQVPPRVSASTLSRSSGWIRCSTVSRSGGPAADQAPNSVTFLRPIDRPCRVEGRGAGVAQPLCFGQISFAASERLFRPLSLGDVPPDAAVADKTSRLVKYRQPRDGHISLAAVGRRPRELEISERQVGIEGLAVLAPGLSVRLEVGHLPAGLADFGARRRRVSQPFGKLLADKAMLRVASPSTRRRRIERVCESAPRSRAALPLPACSSVMSCRTRTGADRPSRFVPNVTSPRTGTSVARYHRAYDPVFERR